jgi:hypothetical protein
VEFRYPVSALYLTTFPATLRTSRVSAKSGAQQRSRRQSWSTVIPLAIAEDLEKIYSAPSEEVAVDELETFSAKWDSLFPMIS